MNTATRPETWTIEDSKLSGTISRATARGHRRRHHSARVATTPTTAWSTTSSRGGSVSATTVARKANPIASVTATTATSADRARSTLDVERRATTGIGVMAVAMIAMVRRSHGPEHGQRSMFSASGIDRGRCGLAPRPSPVGGVGRHDRRITEITVRPPPDDVVFIAVVGVVLGAGLGALVHVTDVPVPFDRGVFRVARVVSPSAFVAVVAGIAVGAALAARVVHTMGAVTVGADAVVLRRGGVCHTVARSAIARVVLDGRRLSLRSASGDELAASKVDVDRAALADAFRVHGYPWSESP